LEYFTSIWYILWQFVTVCGNLAYFSVMVSLGWEKSGNPGFSVPGRVIFTKKIRISKVDRWIMQLNTIIHHYWQDPPPFGGKKTKALKVYRENVPFFVFNSFGGKINIAQDHSKSYIQSDSPTEILFLSTRISMIRCGHCFSSKVVLTGLKYENEHYVN
jgi:hypothetical protein